MAPRIFWKGYLKLSLVTCPVAMVPATSDSDKVRFHTLNGKTGNRVVSRNVDAETGRLVLQVIDRINRELGTATAVITHNAPIAAMADRVLRMTSGHITDETRNVHRSSPEEITW